MKTKQKHRTPDLLLALGLFLSHNSDACVASRSALINYFISYERPYAGLFADGVDVKDVHATVVDRCKESAGQYLMIALALRTQKPNGRTADISLINKYSNDSCKIVNNPFPTAQTYENKAKNFNKQYKFLRACTFLDIVEIDNNGFQFPEKQPASTVEILGNNHIRVEGDFVYLKIKPDNRFAIGVGLKKECTRESTVRAYGFEPGDVQALLNTYIAADASGNTPDLTSLGSTRIRLALSPSSALMNVSASDQPNDVPSWPTTYKTGVEFGNLTIKPERDARTRLDFVPLIDNFSPLRCQNGICSSENSFQTPVSGLVELIDLSSVRRKVIDSWYYGANAPGQYQGLLESVSKYLDPGMMSIGRHYAIEMTMVDPYEDYRLFKSGLSQMIIDLSNLGTVAGLDVMQAFGGISTITGSRALSGLNGMGPDSAQIIQSALQELNDYKGPSHWPPYYESSCLGKNGECFTRGKVKFLKKIGASFTLGEIKADQTYLLNDLRIYSSDPVNGYVERTNNKLSSIDCTGRTTQP